MRKIGKPRAWTWAADSLVLYAIATALLNPLYRHEYLNAWNSIESTFISDARFLREHWPHPGWQPNWYTGTRFDYIYPPALRYGTAALSLLRNVSTARSYHLYIALLYAIGIVGVYWLVRTGSRSRWTAVWAAIASALVSPGYLLFTDLRLDNQGVYWMPLRLSALIRYGEGPHMSALALLPLALLAAWFGLRRGHPGPLALAAVGSALVVAHNFYGATALAMFFPVLAWSVWLAERDRLVWARAALVAALAWCLCAFWLTPSYVRVTLENMRWVSSPGHGWSAALLAVVAAMYLWLSWKFARGRPERTWATFVIGSLVFYGLNVVGNQYIDFRVMGEPKRLVPELDLVIVMSLALLFAWLFRRGGWWRAAVVVVALVCLVPAKGYVRRAWTVLPPRDDYRQRVEYQMTNWIANNLPGVRCFATGSMRFWYNAWHDLPQLGGGSEQGLLNGYVQHAYASAVTAGVPPLDTVAWMQALGTGAVIVHDRTSQEAYHDWNDPAKFEGVLDKAYDDGAGNRIYRIPRRYPDLARVVDAAALRALPPVDGDTLRRYVEVVERGPESRPVVEALGTDALRVRASVAPGQSVVVQQAYDPAWSCWSGGKRVETSKDPIGFLVLDPGPGEQELMLRFETPLENRIGAAAAVAASLAIAGMLWQASRRARG